MRYLNPWIWPCDFPVGCPPERASPTNGMCFRIVKNNPPEESDFVPLYRGNRKRAEQEVNCGRRTLCETMGLSVYVDRIHAVECAQQFPKIGDKIATLALTPAAGKMAPTGGSLPSHNTWWKAQDFDPTSPVQATDGL